MDLIIIRDSTTQVFNTNASLPYNRDLMESVIVKKRTKVDGVPQQMKFNLYQCYHDQIIQAGRRCQTDRSHRNKKAFIFGRSDSTRLKCQDFQDKNVSVGRCSFSILFKHMKYMQQQTITKCSSFGA
ncbi:hypothetical protein T265_08415 [Opisthorchis viverrini]|uniref:Uncharacterized protein n=1 Tax=Opisthorchis viverrini TaxID=6198 RepID=A0A074Z967_OPIVI|nr:hypothetical protein T265_08415 [Opisthorchis viverrini]KER23761.1 hypothetical protein T265_08415 [Opisthorchis viverrini]